MVLRTVLTIILTATSIATPIAFAQTNASQAAAAFSAFEVASIRPHQGPLHSIMGFDSSGPRLKLEGYTLRGLIMEAYNLRNYQVSMAAEDDTFFDVAAKAEGDGSPTRAEFRQMLRALLAERFNLKAHYDLKEMPVYALVVGKNGSKFKESASDTTLKGLVGVNGRNQTLTMPRETMESLANDIWNSNFVDRPVVDRTDLHGTYDIKLEATPAFRIEKNPQPEDLSVFTAIQDQLGLKLEPAKANVQILAVDHVEKPSEN
jgi:uncharacterized protein (TIGR03435 family)